ncbi:MAG: class I SAM-dependent methyltransferase [Pseudomonadota bacterium]
MKYSNPLAEFIASLRRVGLLSSAYLAYSRIYDQIFDRRHGLDTIARLELDELDVEGATVAKGQMYQPTGVLAFQHVMKRLDLPANPILIDFGSGKGRTLILAAMDGRFEKVIGVEFSQELVDIADRNVAVVESKGKLTCPIENICVDAMQYQYRDDETVFYFFYPFDAELMEVVVGQILASLKRKPREARLVYYYPVHEKAMARFEQLNLMKRFDVFGYPCLIYDIVSS